MWGKVPELLDSLVLLIDDSRLFLEYSAGWMSETTIVLRGKRPMTRCDLVDPT